MKTLLIVEDNKVLRRTLKDRMEKEGFLILEAAHGKRLLEIIKEYKVDLILLDLHLPDGNTLNLIDDVKIHTDAPIIIVSSEDDKKMRIKGLNSGADDYVCKPFVMDELVARIKANIRRYVQDYTSPKRKQNFSWKCDRIRFADWVLDRRRFQVYGKKDHQSGDLTMREFKVLEALVNNAGKVLKREDLCEAVREENYVPNPRAIDIKITRIRRKIRDKATSARIIRTIRGAGYVFDAETERMD